MSKLVLIDGHSILTRAFFGIPDLTNSEGLHTNAVYGFLNIMFKILEEEKPEYLIVAFDVKAPTFRHELYNAYKGTRKPMPAELHEQVPVIKEMLSAMNICVMEKAGYEADDILGTLSKDAVKKGYDVVVVSGDRDLLQLAEDNILIRIPKTKRGATEIENYYSADVISTYQVTPLEFIDLKALMGDTADNIPGVKSIGEKTAARLISQYHTVENLYENIESISPERIKNALIAGRDDAFLSKTLATINVNAPVDGFVEEGKITDMFNENAYKMMSRLGFKSMLSRFDGNVADSVRSIDIKAAISELTDKNRLDDVRKELSASTDSYAGMYFDYFEENDICTLVLTSGDRIYYIENNGEITKKDISQLINYISKKCRLAVFDLKELMHRYSRAVNENDGQMSLFAANSDTLEKTDISKIFNSDCDITDCTVGAYLLNPLKDSYTYADVAGDMLGMTVEAPEELLGKLSAYGLYSLDRQKYMVYASYASYIGAASAQIISDRLRAAEMYKLYTDIEYPLIYVLYEMEKNGILVDAADLKDYSSTLQQIISKTEREIFDEIGEEFNINSPKQLGEILFGKLGIPGGKKTKTGYSTSADVLEKLAPEYSVIDKILEYRQLTKLKSTYADGLVSYIASDNRIHGRFNQTITATGRISSTEPNLQNIPIRMEMGKRFRKVFIPKDGYTFIDADYSQIELRILAHMSDDKNLIEAYNSEQDIHKITAAQVFHMPLDEVTPAVRNNAKAVNFGIVYGISSFGLSQDLSISRKEASEYIKQYFETYPGVKKFLDGTVEYAKAHGYVTTLYGRRRPIPELKSSNFMQRSFGERAAMNSAIQGTAADIMKIAMINVYNGLKKAGLKSRILLQVHDELLIETEKSETETVKAIVKDAMMSAARLNVTLEIDLEQGCNWLEAH